MFAGVHAAHAAGAGPIAKEIGKLIGRKLADSPPQNIQAIRQVLSQIDKAKSAKEVLRILKNAKVNNYQTMLWGRIRARLLTAPVYLRWLVLLKWRLFGWPLG